MSAATVLDNDDYTNVNKYIVVRSDFRHVPRWPNDGIQAQQEAFRNGTNEHHEFETSDPDQLELTTLMGGWMMGKPLAANDDDPATRDFVLSLPWTRQHMTALEQQEGSNSEQAAKEFLIDAYKTRKNGVKTLLEKIGCRSAVHKASRDARRFPEMRAIIVPLLEKRLGSEENVELLFGRVERVRPLLLDVGSEIAGPAPPGSPAHAFMQTFQSPKVAPAAKQCAECGTMEGNIRGCRGCYKSVHYCSKECQTAHWAVHKPDCFRAQGKAVSESVRVKAEQAQLEREAKERANARDEDQAHSEKIQAEIEAFTNESPEKVNTFSHTCFGRRRRVDLPWSAVDVEIVVGVALGLEFEKVLQLIVFPDGIPHESCSGRGVLLKDLQSGAKIIVLHERLFADGGNGDTIDGYALDGIFVVDKVNKSTKTARWKQVAVPSYPIELKRLDRFAMYLTHAKEQSKVVPTDIDLGIQDTPDLDKILSFAPTVNGNFVQTMW